jgi:hypothetical protein
MAIYNNLESIRRLSTSSLTSIVDITNLNFKSLSDANLEFLNNIQYDEATNSFQVYTGSFDFVNINDTLSLNLDGVPTFTINSLGDAVGQTIHVQIAETKRIRMIDFNDWPDVGVPGEIVYTGIQNQKPEFGEDFIGYLQGRGWVSLTDINPISVLTFNVLTETSPPVPACPSPDTGILWVGPPGYATATVPTTQTIYYTDENCDIFDLTVGTGGGGGNAIDVYSEGLPAVTAIATLNIKGPNAIVVDAGGNQADITIGTKTTIGVSETLIIPADYQYLVYGSFGVYGTIYNYGEIVILNGNLNLFTGGLIVVPGTIKEVNVSTGDSMRVVIKNFSTLAGVSVTLNHALGTKDFVFVARDGDTYIEVDLVHLDTNNVQITPTGNVSSGVVIFQAKLP